MYTLAVLGNPIEHSLSPVIHNFFAKSLGIDINYQKILVQNDFKSFIADFSKIANGCNVTIPFKEDAYTLSDELSPEAQCAQAVNTLLFKDKKIIGHNTDGLGFILDLQDKGCHLENKSVLVIGAGGATLGILKPLIDSKVKSITLVNRTDVKAFALKDKFNSKLSINNNILAASKLDTLNNSSENFDLIINASASSLYKELPNINDAILAKASYVYDLMYTKEGDTIFTSHCKNLGVENSLAGLGMLIRQAAFSFKFWTDTMPSANDCEAYIKDYLNSK